MVKHIVLFRLRADASEEDAAKALAALGELVGVIPGLLDFSGGANNSPEGRAQGYTHGFAMTFDSAASRDGYVPHPEHRRAAASLRACADGVLVFDYGE